MFRKATTTNHRKPLNFSAPVTRRRLRRPQTAVSKTVSVSSKDQDIAASVNRFRVRSRPGHKKTSDNSLSESGVAKKDKDGYKVVCYYTNWSQYRTKVGKFLPEDILPDLCTHLIFAFGWLKKGKLSSFESNDETKDGKTGLYERVQNLKKANPNLKTLLAIGESTPAGNPILALFKSRRAESICDGVF